MRFQSEFLLNRPHLEECYDESLPFTKNNTPRYKFMALLITTAIAIFIFTDEQDVLAYFLLGLAIVEWFSFRYRRAWWLTRQVWSKNSGNTIQLIVDDKGIEIKSVYSNSQLLWEEIINIDETHKGFRLVTKNGACHYISKSTINEQAQDLILQHAKQRDR